MRGSKPLNDQEIVAILAELPCDRDRALFILGVRTGFRISELLSLTVADVTQYGEVRGSITVSRKSMKGKDRSRTVVLHEQAKCALKSMLTDLKCSQEHLFPFTRQYAHKIIKEACRRARIEGRVSTHSMRKSFAKRVYEKLNKDLVATQQALGHASITSTTAYLSFDQDAIDRAIKGA